MRVLLILIVGISLTACKSKKNITHSEDVASSYNLAMASEDSLLILYQTSPCFGRCPVFTLSIYKSGYARLSGSKNIDNIGSFSAQLEQERIENLFLIADTIGFFEMDSVYDGTVTDLPSKTITFNRGQTRKRVMDRYMGPASLQVLHETFRKMAEESIWNPYQSGY